MITTKTTPAVGYVRMSTDKQEASPQQQREEIEKLAEAKGYHVVRWYDDHGISGDDTQKRKGFQRMIADASEIGDFEAILCWDQDRFGRFDSLEAGKWICPLRDVGVYLVTVTQGVVDWTDFAGRMIYSIQQEAKHGYLQDLSRNVLRGQVAAASSSTWHGGSAPYGYRLDNRHLVLGSAEKVATVRWMFDTYAKSDTSLWAMVDQLNSRGVPSPTGKLWRAGSIQKILTNPAYRGDKAWNRRNCGKYHRVDGGSIERATKKTTMQWNGEENWIVVEGTHEPIIDRELWARVQEKLRRRQASTTPKRGGGPFLLSGLLVCGRCGKRMHARHEFKHGTKTSTVKYQCSGYRQHGKGFCGYNTVRQSVLVDGLINVLEDRLTHPGNLERLRASVERQARRRNGNGRSEVDTLRADVARLDEQIDSAADRLLRSPDDLFDLLAPKLRTMKDERVELTARLQAAEAAANAPQISVDEVVEQAMSGLQRLREAIEAANPALARELFRQFADKVELWFDAFPKKKQTEYVLSRGVIHLSNTFRRGGDHLAQRCPAANDRTLQERLRGGRPWVDV